MVILEPRRGGLGPDDEPTLGDVVFVLCVILGLSLVFLQGCRPERPACRPETLAAIESAYVAEVVATCTGKTMATCPELPAIETKYRAMREGWIQCR